MAKAEGLPPTASVVVPGPSLNYVGVPGDRYCYAYSGPITIGTGDTETLFLFTTETGIIKCQLQSGRNVKAAAEHEHYVYFNDVLIWYSKMDNGTAVSNQAPNSIPLLLLMPPLTKVEIQIKSLDDETTNQTMILTGRVYGV